VQTEFVLHPQTESFRSYQFVEVFLVQAVGIKVIKRSAYLGRLAGIPALSTRPLKKDFRIARVWCLVVTLTTHQEKVGGFVRAAKGTRNNMTTLKRDSIPAGENFAPVCISPFDIIFRAVVKSASPTSRFAPINKEAQSGNRSFQ
jgi:hypothetical protein